MSGNSIDYSMLEIFRTEATAQTQVLTSGLLRLEREPASAETLEACMRAAHSLKGASRIVGLSAGVDISHVIEDGFVAAQHGRQIADRPFIDLMLRGVDLFTRLAHAPQAELEQLNDQRSGVDDFIAKVNQTLATQLPADKETAPSAREPEAIPIARDDHEASERVLRIAADSLNRLLALAGESVVESARLKTFSRDLSRLKRTHNELDKLLGTLLGETNQEQAEAVQIALKEQIAECRRLLAERTAEVDILDYRSNDLARRLYNEALNIRMRPFSDGIQGFDRMVRDMGRSLNKEIRLEVSGEETQIDRDILERLKSPLNHLLRNAIDHGIESVVERRAVGKPAEAVIRLEARHSAGLLQISVSDDGRGIDLERLRESVVQRKLARQDTAPALSESELLDFLFLPGFSMKTEVTEISGRGVGLDVVRNMVRQVRGAVRVFTQSGQGLRFQLQLPVTLSVLRCLLVQIGGEPYAFPLAHVVRAMKVTPDQVESLEGRPHIAVDGRRVGLIAARQILGCESSATSGPETSVVIVGGETGTYALEVERFMGERELVIQPLDKRLDKVKDISAGAVMEDGSPVLIVDTEDMICSIDKLVVTGRPDSPRRDSVSAVQVKRKRVLVVDDSLTVRELERKLLTTRGYEVEVAVDGVDGWNAVRGSSFDLVVSDVDMPRMDGIGLIKLIRKDQALKSLPVMIVSYKDRAEDRNRGLDAGADYYLAKGNFHDDALLQAVVDLIGEAQT